jgi:hypothetical protein
VPQDVPHTHPDGRIVGVTPPEMIPEPDEFALGQARDHQDRPLTMPAGHEDRHAASAIKSGLRADEPRMNVSTAVGPWSDRKRHTGSDGFVFLRCPHDRARHPEVPTTEGSMANGAEAAFTRQERPAALGARDPGGTTSPSWSA